MNNIIQPTILKGFRDFFPADMVKRQYVMEKVKQVFMNYGYDTIETPVIEYAETLLGKYGEEGSKLTYTFEDNGKRKVALRYDQTVPFARFIAMYNKQLPMPFKRYEISRVWRADKPAKGRYREFYQCDIDIIGTESLLAEAEIAKVVYAVFSELGFDDFKIKYNSRRLINDVLNKLEIDSDQQIKIIQILDKLDKISKSEIEEELLKTIDKTQLEKLLQLFALTGSDVDIIEQLSDYDTSEIKDFYQLCQQFGIKSDNLELDISLARGLDYYTGIVYEVVIPSFKVGSVCGGGRYDNLCSLFSKEKFSGVGVAFGFDRMVLAMEEQGKLNNLALNSKVLVTYFDNETLPASLQALEELQSLDINAEIYFEPTKLAKQFKYADKKLIPFVVICGPEEVANDQLTIKMMKTGKQKTIPNNQLSSYFNGLKKI